VAKFVFVYLFEAHATDEWPLGDAVVVNQHQTLEDRIAAAKLLQDKYHAECDIYVDSMDNSFNDIYAAWPERFYIIHMTAKGTNPAYPNYNKQYPYITHIAQPSLEDRGFNRNDIATYLDEVMKRATPVTQEIATVDTLAASS